MQSITGQHDYGPAGLGPEAGVQPLPPFVTTLTSPRAIVCWMVEIDAVRLLLTDEEEGEEEGAGSG